MQPRFLQSLAASLVSLALLNAAPSAAAAALTSNSANTLAIPADVCPDIALELTQFPMSNGGMRVTVKIVNASDADYVSELGLQKLVILGAGGEASSVPFGTLGRGDEIVWGQVLRTPDAMKSFQAHIEFDPAIHSDGNPANDDCSADNNQAAFIAAS